ncbi:MAG: LysR family transcriptional regulator [Hyphomicrobiales bacterium]
MEIRSLYTFLAIVNHRSFVEAGKAVGLSPSGVSLQIRALEQQVGIALFDRSTRPPKLTADGQNLVNRARELIDVWERMTGEVSFARATGILELGALQTVVDGILPSALSRLRSKHPHLEFRLITALSNELEPSVERGSLDVAVVTQPPTILPGLRWEPFCTEPLMVVAPRSASGTTDQQLLEELPYICFRRTTRAAWIAQSVDDELNRRGINLRPQMEVGTLDGIFKLVENGLGVSIVPRRRVANPFPPGIVAVPFGDPPVSRTLGLLYRDDNPRRQFIGDLYDALMSASEAEGPPQAAPAGPVVRRGKAEAAGASGRRPRRLSRSTR